MHIRTRLDRSPAATVAQHINRHVDTFFDAAGKPCIIFSRYLFVSKEMRKVNSSTDKMQIQSISPGFNVSLFHRFGIVIVPRCHHIKRESQLLMSLDMMGGI